MTKYICQKCNHCAGYHTYFQSKRNFKKYGKCRVIGCDCDKFVWDEEQLKELEKKQND